MAVIMTMVVPVEGGEHLIPLIPPLLSERTETPPNPLSRWQRKAASMTAVDGSGQQLIRPTTMMTVALNPLSP
jgi:hypothetical protein